MSKFVFLIVFVSSMAMISACSTASAPSGNGNTAASANVNAPANMPEGFSNVPITPSGNPTPGIPDPSNVNINTAVKGATPTPGIPDPKDIGKTPVPKGATPTPGIPDPKQLQEQMRRTINNANVVNQVPKTVQEAEQKVNEQLKQVRKSNQ